mgnify:CR=1 FL=1|tara:strand:- start:362 stop:1624 length:1263 start_codon:yes stop_codon:yes gene_type:complete
MGNSISNIKENTNDVTEYLLKIDSLAAKFVTSSNISQNKKIGDLYFCDDLVIMTGDVLANKLNSMDIEYLKQRTEKGVVIDDMTTDKVIFFNKSQKDNLDIKNKTEKRRICNGISKFYVKIAQLYAAILKTINPVYKYKDEYGNEKLVPHNKKHSIPSHLNYSLTQINLCNRRLNALLNSQDYTTEKDKDVFVHPDLCKINMNDDKGMNLLQEEGMVEFGQLFKDVYNYDTGKFDSISDKMKVEYQKALTVFYNTYTGNSGKLPEDIKKFSDIKLRQFSKKECLPDGNYNKKYKGTLSEELFQKYALHLKEMYMKINKNEETIVNVLKEIFSIIKTQKGEKVIINPKLTYENLDKFILQTQQLITTLYVTCEEDFLKGVQIFQEIVLHQNNIINEQKRENIKDGFEKTLTGESDNTEVSL